MYGALEFEEFEPLEFFSKGNRVVAIGRERALARSTGRSYENDWAMVFTVRFGQITSLRVFEDTTPIIQAIRSK